MSLNKTFTIPKSNKAYPLDEFNKDLKLEWENTKKVYVVDDFIDDLIKDFENAKS